MPTTVSIRSSLEAAAATLAQRFEAGDPIVDLVHARSASVDEALIALWQLTAGDLAESVALVAVGGYGRGELHPSSDVDILLLLPDDFDPSDNEKLSAFVTGLWDLGLEIGHSVRSIEQCVEEARDDLTVATTLMEARLVMGPASLVDAMLVATAPDRIWPSDEFFAEKRKEQIARHRRYDDTGYNLEPNVKGSPGGLRDIQLVGWVAKRHFGCRTLSELVDHEFLTPGQRDRLLEGQAFLWRVRFALHTLTGRREDRILFDYQIKLAEMLGYEDATYTLAVEQMMQRYYRTVMDLSRLNEILLQLFEEAILLDPEAQAEPLNERFQVKNGYLQTVDEQVFQRDPSALLELFLLLQQNPDIRGVSAYTVGLIKRNLHLIDDEFRQKPGNHRLFLQILRAPEGVTHELKRMNLYGVLGLYIPAFGRIVGRMQYDLFHAYTVDEHTLFVVSNLRRFALTRFDHEFPHCSQIMQSFEKPEIAYLSGLFHDIAKGRGGDHSELGAVDAEAFCLEHGMDQADAATVAWLVRHHLELSTTAQKKDIGDPDVINEFAAFVGDQRHLDYLYVLTVADVRGTNPKLWNSWKASLFRGLYQETSRALGDGLDHPVASDQLVDEKRAKARRALNKSGMSDDSIDRVWQLLDDNYILKHKSDEIAWHTRLLSGDKTDLQTSLVDLRRGADGDGIEAVLYTPRVKRTFAQVTAVVDELAMSIVDARIVPLKNDYSLDTYVFVDPEQRSFVHEAHLDKVREMLTRILEKSDEDIVPVTRAVPRQARMFSTETEVSFSCDESRDRTILELVAADRPGLLSKVGRAFIACGVNIEAAKIMTIGERAEDAFYITDESGKPLTDEVEQQLGTDILKRLGNQA